MKYDSGGNVQWARQFGTANAEEILSVAPFGASGVVTGGWTLGGLQGSGLGNIDNFVRLYDGAGNTVWTKQFGTSTAERVYGVGADGLGHIYAAGYTSGVIGSSNFGLRDVFVTQLNATTGAIIWSRQFGTTSSDYGRALAVDSLGNVYVAGETNGPLFGPNSGGDAFVIKLDVSGATVWSKQITTSGADSIWSLAVDQTGDLIVGGFTSGVIGAASQGGSDGFALKLSKTDGAQIWATQFGSSGTDEVYGIALDGAGRVVLGGFTTGTFTGQTANGGQDGFVQTLDANGVPLRSEQFGTAGDDKVQGVGVNQGDKLLAAGLTSGSYPGFSNAGLDDAFLTQRPGVIPEPASASLLSLAAGMLLARRRRVEV